MQFCPIALASEIVAERWTPLILRELLLFGSRRFEDVMRGVPAMSRSMLAKRLEQLARAGVIERRAVGDGKTKRPEYELTDAGRELYPVIEQLGVWGHRWLRNELRDEHLDPRYLMWLIGRRVDPARMPARRVVVLFDFEGTPMKRSRFWAILDRPNVDVCQTNPSFPVDLTVRSPLRTLVEAWRGFIRTEDAVKSGQIRLEGPPDLCRAFPAWLPVSRFASVALPPPGGKRRD